MAWSEEWQGFRGFDMKFPLWERWNKMGWHSKRGCVRWEGNGKHLQMRFCYNKHSRVNMAVCVLALVYCCLNSHAAQVKWNWHVCTWKMTVIWLRQHSFGCICCNHHYLHRLAGHRLACNWHLSLYRSDWTTLLVTTNFTSPVSQQCDTRNCFSTVCFQLNCLHSDLCVLLLLLIYRMNWLETILKLWEHLMIIQWSHKWWLKTKYNRMSSQMLQLNFIRRYLCLAKIRLQAACIKHWNWKLSKVLQNRFSVF